MFNTPKFPRFLFHGTSAAFEADIRSRGLVPRCELRRVLLRDESRFKRKTRADTVYLTDRGPLPYAFFESSMIQTRQARDLLIVVIDTLCLKEGAVFEVEPPAEAGEWQHLGIVPPSALVELKRFPYSVFASQMVRVRDFLDVAPKDIDGAKFLYSERGQAFQHRFLRENFPAYTGL